MYVNKQYHGLLLIIYSPVLPPSPVGVASVVPVKADLQQLQSSLTSTHWEHIGGKDGEALMDSQRADNPTLG